MFDNYKLLAIDLQRFAELNTNVTTDSGLSDAMKTYYSDYLLDQAQPKLVHDQFGQTHPIPKHGGKTIEFRKYSPLPKMLTPLQEGVTPNGQKLALSVITATINQYGGYVAVSDILKLTAIDDQIVQATKQLSRQAGKTLDTISREELNGGTNVIYSGGRSARYQLVGGSSTAANNHYLAVDDVKRAVRQLKTMNADPIGDSWVAIIHPDMSYDLTNDSAWVNVKTYADPKDMYAGEIGRLYGVRFVETTEAKIFHAPNLVGTTRNLSVKNTLSSAGKTVEIKEALSTAAAAALAGRKVIIGAALHEIDEAAAGAAGAATITTKANVATTDGVQDAIIYPGEAGAAGRDVYSTLVLGADAYGKTSLEGGGLEHIVMPHGSGGTSDPLKQRGTVGWKATKVTKRLYEEYMVRIESACTFQSGAN